MSLIILLLAENPLKTLVLYIHKYLQVYFFLLNFLILNKFIF